MKKKIGGIKVSTILKKLRHYFRHEPWSHSKLTFVEGELVGCFVVGGFVGGFVGVAVGAINSHIVQFSIVAET